MQDSMAQLDSMSGIWAQLASSPSFSQAMISAGEKLVAARPSGKARRRSRMVMSPSHGWLSRRSRRARRLSWLSRLSAWRGCDRPLCQEHARKRQAEQNRTAPARAAARSSDPERVQAHHALTWLHLCLNSISTRRPTRRPTALLSATTGRMWGLHRETMKRLTPNISLSPSIGKSSSKLPSHQRRWEAEGPHPRSENLEFMQS